jgi:hypothetical protein
MNFTTEIPSGAVDNRFKILKEGLNDLFKEKRIDKK